MVGCPARDPFSHFSAVDVGRAGRDRAVPRTSILWTLVHLGARFVDHLFDRGEESCPDRPFPSQHLIAPPGYSVMLSPILLFWGDTPLLAIRLLHLAALVVIALLTFFIHRRELSAGWATLAAIFV